MNYFRLSQFVILALSLASPALLKAAVSEEYKSIQTIDQEQTSPTEDKEVRELEEPTEAKPAEPTHTSKAENKPVEVVAYQQPRHYHEDSVLEAEHTEVEHKSSSIGFTPMLGVSSYVGTSASGLSWANNIRNQYSLGLALDFPMSRFFSLEVEGGVANYRIAYQPNVGPFVAYAFNQYQLGGNGKIYLTETRLRPFIGGGIAGLFYDHMSRTVAPGERVQFSQMVGVANLMAGMEYRLSETVSLGARAAYLIPVFNRPYTYTIDGGATSAPGFEEAGAMNTNLVRVMGTVTIRM